MTAQQPRRSHKNYAPPGFLLWLWPFLDRIISKWLAIEPLRKDKISIISIKLRRHRGQPIPLDDGTIITPGNLLIELHLNNAWFLHHRGKVANSAGGRGWRASAAFAEDLKYLAEQLAKGRFATEIKALHGITLLDSLARRHSFTVIKLPDSLRRRLTMFYLSGLRQMYYSGKGKEYIALRRPPALQEIWMSKSSFLKSMAP